MSDADIEQSDAPLCVAPIETISQVLLPTPFILGFQRCQACTQFHNLKMQRSFIVFSESEHRAQRVPTKTIKSENKSACYIF